MKIYFISGLGADERIFQKLEIPSEYEVVHLSWIVPLKGEKVEAYVKRLSAQINSSEPFVLIGLSFGGMLVSELLKFLKPERAIVISSFKSEWLPWYFRFARFTRLYKILPYSLFKMGNRFIYWLMGMKTKEEKILLKQILKDSDKRFIKWAVHTLLHWQNKEPDDFIFHIHGNNDKLVPLKYVKPDAVVNKGGHLMVYTHAWEVSSIIADGLR
ncbi:MAG TPA: alpha/beta hydrolase [Flavobacteriales bacterium]|nr:alpha/beta hydrolase [Flavobacteriales bacterium]